MPQLEPKPEEFRPGMYTLSVESLNKLVRSVIRQIRGGQGVTTGYYGDRILVGTEDINPQLPDIGNYLTQFVVLEEGDDYLLCTPFQQPSNTDKSEWVPQIYDKDLGKDQTIQISVAKPYDLQRTPWDGQTVEMNGKTLSITYTGLGERSLHLLPSYQTLGHERITPNYFPGDVILACKATTGLTGDDDLPVVWEDVNAGSRTWGYGEGGPVVYGVNNPYYEGGNIGPTAIDGLTVDGMTGLYLLPGNFLTYPTGLTLTATTSGGTLVDGTTYYYQVTSVSANGETRPSPEQSITVHSPNLIVSFSIGLIPGAIGYRIYRTTTSGVYGPSSLIYDFLIEIGPFHFFSGEGISYNRLTLIDFGRPYSAGAPPTNDTSFVGPALNIAPANGLIGGGYSAWQSGVVVPGYQFMPGGVKTFSHVGLATGTSTTAIVSVFVIGGGYPSPNTQIGFYDCSMSGGLPVQSSIYADLWCSILNTTFQIRITPRNFAYGSLPDPTPGVATSGWSLTDVSDSTFASSDTQLNLLGISNNGSIQGLTTFKIGMAPFVHSNGVMDMQVHGNLIVDGFFLPGGGSPVVSGSRGGNAALASLLSALVSLGIITDFTTP